MQNKKFNLLSISQLCDKGNKVIFDKEKCEVQDESGTCILTTPRSDNVYAMNANKFAGSKMQCLKALTEDSRLWHRKLGHISLHSMNKLVAKGLVRGLPDMKFQGDELCKACT